MIPSPRNVMRNLKKPLLAAVLGLLLGLALIEVALRILVFFNRAYVPPAPEQASQITSRRENLAMRKKNQEIVILFEGASYTRGIGAPPDKTYPMQLQNLLNSKLKGKRVTVINKGLSNQNTTELRLRLAEDIDQIKPDLLLVLIGMANDWNRKGYELYENAGNSGIFLSNILHEIRIYRLVGLLIHDYSVATTVKETSVPGSPKALPANIRAAIEQTGSDPTKAFEVGQYFRTIDEVDKALSWFEQGLAQRPRDERNYCGIMMVYRNIGSFDQGRLYGERAIAENPHNFDNYICLAYLHTVSGDYDNALNVLEKGLNECPDFALSQSLMGLDAYRVIFAKIYRSEPKKNSIRRSRALALLQKIEAKAPGYFYPVDHDPIAERGANPAGGPEQGHFHFFWPKNDPSGWRTHDLEEIVKMARIRKVPIFLQTYPNAYYPEINRVAREWGVPLVDHLKIFNEMGKTGKYDKYDFFESKAGNGNHCNAKGYGVMAENIFKKLIEEQIDWVVH